MPYRKKVADLMIPLEDYPHVPYWFTLRQAMAIVREAAIASACIDNIPFTAAMLPIVAFLRQGLSVPMTSCDSRWLRGLVWGVTAT